MTLAQLEERVASLEQIKERLVTLERIVERLQTQVNGESNALSASNVEERDGAEEDLIPGTEYDLVVTVPPYESFHIQGRIVSIQTPPAELGLSDEEWALFGSEDDDE